MKSLLALIIFIGSISIGQAQEQKQEWQTDLGDAKTLAAESDLPIIMVFQGSDWCIPCMKLEKQVWSTNEFQDYAEDHFVMLKVDFPRRKGNRLPEEQQQKNEALAETYNTHGYFPLVVILDDKGTVLGETGYKDVTPKEYIELLESFNL